MMMTTAARKRFFYQLEDLNQRVWGDRITLATTNHMLAGLGIGFLVNQRTKSMRSLAYLLLASSVAAHAYAWVKRRQESEEIQVSKEAPGLHSRNVGGFT